MPLPFLQNVSCNKFTAYFIAENDVAIYTCATWIFVGYFDRADAAAVVITTTDLVSKSVGIETKVSYHCRVSIFCCNFQFQLLQDVGSQQDITCFSSRNSCKLEHCMLPEFPLR